MFVTSITCDMFCFDYFAITLNSQLFIIVLTLKSLNFYLFVIKSIIYMKILLWFLNFFLSFFLNIFIYSECHTF